MYKKPRLIPCLLIQDGALVKTVNFKKGRYIGDPINAVKIFNEEEADELCLLDISSHKNRCVNFDLLEEIAGEAFMPLSYGGYINSLDDVKRLIRTGFEKVIFNTALVKNQKLVMDAVQYAGSQSVVASVDYKRTMFGKEECFIECGKTRINEDLINYIHKIEKLGVGEILINSINNDGMMKGYDIDTIKKVTNDTLLPVICCGGAGSIKDMVGAIKDGKAHAVAAGSMFVYYGSRKAVLINYPSETEQREAGFDW